MTRAELVTKLLKDKGPMTSNQIAEALGKTPKTISALLCNVMATTDLLLRERAEFDFHRPNVTEEFLYSVNPKPTQKRVTRKSPSAQPVLQLLRDRGPMYASAIAQAVGLPHNTCKSLLRSMVLHGGRLELRGFLKQKGTRPLQLFGITAIGLAEIGKIPVPVLPERMECKPSIFSSPWKGMLIPPAAPPHNCRTELRGAWPY